MRYLIAIENEMFVETLMQIHFFIHYEFSGGNSVHTVFLCYEWNYFYEKSCMIQGVSRKRYFRRKGLLFCEKRRTQEIEGEMVWFGLCSKVYTMEVDRREKSVEQYTNAILNPSARSENTLFVNCPVLDWKYLSPLMTVLLVNFLNSWVWWFDQLSSWLRTAFS